MIRLSLGRVLMTFLFINFIGLSAVNAQFNVSGDASTLGGGCYQITDGNSQSGAVWNTSMIDLTEPFEISLTLNFGNNDGGADGLSFILQPISSGVASDGSGVGYEGITPSLGVVFDDFENPAYGDPAADHMSMHKNGVVDHGVSSELVPVSGVTGFPFNIEDGNNHTFRFKWTPGTPNGTIQVWFDGVLSFTYTGDIVNTIFGGNPMVYWGASGSTGGYSNVQTVCMNLVADFTATNGCAGQAIQFTDMSISGQPIASYKWDFGDGTIWGPGIGATYKNPTHVYTAPGNYTVQLTVTNSAGLTSTTTAMITVFGPTVTISTPPTTICQGASITLNGSVVPNPATTNITVPFSNNTAFPIPDGGVSSSWNGTAGTFATSNIVASGINPSWGIDSIRLNIAHTYDDDVIVYLKTPCGNLIRLIKSTGSGSDGFVNTCFTPNAGTAITAGSYPFTGKYIPFDGAAAWATITGCATPNGTWSLIVGDAYSSDSGTLTNWSIYFRNPVPTTFTYNWTPINVSNTLSPSVNPTTTTTYSLIGIDVNGCRDTAQTTITVGSSVAPTFASVGPFCSGAIIPALPTTSTNGIVGSWTPALNNTATTTYTFIPTVAQCATNTTLTITIDSNITPTFTQVGPFCEGTAISALPTTSINGITGTWAPVINNTVTTTYTFTPNAGQCATTKTMTITINPNITPTFTQTGPYCEGATISALPLTSINGIPGNWAPAINNTATTTYTFTPTTGQCAANTTMTITINPNITPTFSAVGPYCAGEIIPPLSTTSINGISGTWFPAINNTVTTTYTYTPATGQCATTTTQIVEIINQIIPEILSNDTTICNGSIPFTINTSNHGGTWTGAGMINPMNGVFDPSVAGVGSHVITYQLNTQCGGRDSITVSVEKIPTAIISGDSVRSICEGQTTVLNGYSNVSYLWSTGENTSTITVSTGGVYVLNAVNFCGLATDTVMVIEHANPILNIGRDTALCLMNGLMISTPDNFQSYQWSSGENSNVIMVQHQGRYTLTVTNEFGCESSDQIFVIDSCDNYFYVPNAFTPDADHLNNEFKPKGINVIDYDMKIFDRWGKMIFQSFDINKGWNGRDNSGNDFPMGSYVCIIDYSVLISADIVSKQTYIGPVTIIR